MTNLRVDDFSVAITAFFLKLIGLWFAGSSCERWLRNITLCYTMGMIFFAVYLQTTLIYHSTDDFENCLFAMLNLLSTTVPMFKILILLPRREKFFHLILHMVRNFFHANYDDYETLVLTNCKRKCSFFACTFVCFTELTIISYVFTPLIGNLGKNETERLLPFKMWVNLPMQKTPYFEIAYIAQSLSLCTIGFAYLCIDNMLCIINLHLAGQFRILQYRLSEKYTAQDQNNVGQESKNILYLANNASGVFKSYIRQHQSLMKYCEEVEAVFSTVVLIQVLTFSMLICLDGYLILVAEMAQRKVMFVCHFAATVCQLVMFSYGCDCIIRESTKLATAAYSGPWLQLSPTKSVKEVKKNLIMFVMRSNIPCYLTGSGFFIASLETCTKVLTTAASYFTLLQETQNSISA